METVASQKSLLLTNKKHTIQLQRAEELSFEARTRLKGIAQKFLAGMQAVKELHYGICFAAVEDAFLSGAYDNIIQCTSAPQTSAIAWCFIRQHVASSKQEERQREIQKAEEHAQKLEEEFQGQKQADQGTCLPVAALDAYTAKLKTCFMKSQDEVQRHEADMQVLTSAKAERAAQNMRDGKGSLLATAEPKADVIHTAVCKWTQPKLCIVDVDALPHLSKDVLTAMIRGSEPGGAVMLCLPPAFQTSARSAETLIASALVETGATRVPLQLRLPSSGFSSAVLLLSHESEQTAEAASDLLQKMVTATPLRTGVLSLQGSDGGKRVLEIMQAFNVADVQKVVVLLDLHAKCCLDVARAVIPQPLLVITESTAVCDELKQLESLHFKTRVLQKTMSETTTKLERMAMDLPNLRRWTMS
ncbi:hypothetical protein AK812_SmicGene31781 [Symbiodinium microadriaticum]|uniref:Uncharacterized protein n=1 Tax=Symbiodinium microadriaticum TaxID=2951 RepID=A0A1Q9CVT7_SYMMI|nr:hypothetical protein AK812_SmicGene31781 [Symbiodinium microadriaticum]CAE7324359.1 unnamed protein product [Symbiodinium microadriaticum]